jgi:2-polyprenyl-3-methyl-5-hydroxy-6-metoxy-1,4-benzoquinol methylase
MNRLRIPLIRDGIINVAGTSQQKTRYSKPLEGVTILDVGCGGRLVLLDFVNEYKKHLIHFQSNKN